MHKMHWLKHNNRLSKHLTIQYLQSTINDHNPFVLIPCVTTPGVARARSLNILSGSAQAAAAADTPLQSRKVQHREQHSTAPAHEQTRAANEG